ncbi:hypothetical protein PC116_g10902 [Phytophthora cactorum]|nr:hypothetical protein Pcac1_g29044 [Phytophthora cactorum]KAG4241169.1 hypothetical protein PC116_g10902 [Phytophthora cactorum]
MTDEATSAAGMLREDLEHQQRVLEARRSGPEQRHHRVVVRSHRRVPG